MLLLMGGGDYEQGMKLNTFERINIDAYIFRKLYILWNTQPIIIFSILKQTTSGQKKK
jgi:hypothetical protein